MRRIIQLKKNTEGSLSLEAAVITPAFFAVFFIIITLIQYMYIYADVYRCAIRTAEYMSYYSIIYYDNGLDLLTDSAKAKISGYTNGKYISLIAAGGDLSDSAVCASAAKKVFDSIYKDSKSRFKADSISFAGSSFFQSGDNFTMSVSGKFTPLFNVSSLFGKGFHFSVNVKGKGWMRGNIADEVSKSVWSMNQLERGKILEKIFGSNLPDNYPVIDIFDKSSGRATLIISLDHTKPGYSGGTAITQKLKTSLNNLKNFSGTENNNAVEKQYRIKSSEIKHKKMLLIIPENEMTMTQAHAIVEFGAFCGTYGIEFEYVCYQKSE